MSKKKPVDADLDLTRNKTSDETCPDGEDCPPIDETCPDGVCPDGEGCIGGECCEHFEAKIPFDCVMRVITLIREGKVFDAKLELLMHCAWIIGCAAKLAHVTVNSKKVGSEDCPDGVCPEDQYAELVAQTKDCQQAAVALSMDDIADSLEKICDDEGNCEVGSDGKTKFISPEMIALILQLIQMFIRR